MGGGPTGQGGRQAIPGASEGTRCRDSPVAEPTWERIAGLQCPRAGGQRTRGVHEAA